MVQTYSETAWRDRKPWEKGGWGWRQGGEQGKADTNKWFLLEPTVPGSSSPGDNFGDEDAGVIADVGVVAAASDAEAQARVTLQHLHESPCNIYMSHPATFTRREICARPCSLSVTSTLWHMLSSMQSSALPPHICFSHIKFGQDAPISLQHSVIHTLGLVLFQGHKYTVAYTIINAPFSITHKHLFFLH